MEVCSVPSLFSCVMTLFLLVFYLNLFAIPFGSSALQLSNRRHPRHLSNASDQEALFGFISAITYDPYHSLTTSWKPNVSFCEWRGVRCSRRRQRVVSLNVSSMGLQGTISPLLGNLSFLRILDLGNNSFHGHIPYGLGNLFRLKALYLYQNQLQGYIPPTLAACRSLVALSMLRNNLIGNIPSELCVLPKLQFLNLQDNNINGTIPACLGNISSFDTIGLAYNNLIGNIPSELCVLPKLQFLNLQDNNITGTIPACLGNISSLDTIGLGYNNLHGNIPSQLGLATKLRVISLHVNNFRGQIPPSLYNCTSLEVLDITLNQLTGYIPAESCSKNTKLMILYLGGNQLSGSIPASLFNCTNLQVFDLGDNQLSGVVPLELGKLTQLRWINLQGNQWVSGSTTTLPILTALANCSALHVIHMGYNHLTGRLPSSIGHLSKQLSILDIPSSELTGEIPPHIGNLTSLTLLDLSTNYFTGPIPSSFIRLQKLERLFIQSNNLQGNIPMEIGQLKSLGSLLLAQNNLSGRIFYFSVNFQQLRYLDLSQNQLSGNIPANIGKCRNLLLLDLSYNRLSGHIPPEVAGLENLAFYLNFSNNFLHGPMPSEVSKMTMVPAIDISANRLSGNIPNALGNCKEIEYLNLSSNKFEGPIPVSLGELQSLQDMDFSSNNLSGEIPLSLENLKMLDHLNFSFNNLSGAVPKGGVFKKLGATAFMGNLGLCGPWVTLSPCSDHRHKSVSHLKRVIIPVVALAIIGVSCLFLWTLWRRNCKRHILQNVGTSLKVGYPRVSYGEIITATDEFSEANLLGIGSFGKVYKGVLNDGTIVAVKVLNLENEGAQKSFDKECKVLAKIKHRNLIKIITCYSDLQMKALIFPLMPNGSLEKWLAPNGEEECALSLIQRLNIAIDIAQGMAYLHHYCFVQVIHCDLKPTNVLLGEDMTAYIIDFGIATIYFSNSDDSALTSTHALKGSAGYIPPEYGLGGRVTAKGDIYSYGIVLLQMLTRKKPTNNMFVEGMNLQKWVGASFPNQIGEVVDKSLLKSANTIIEEDKKLTCLSHLISVGLLCTQESPERRPNMVDIVSQLQNIKDVFLGNACTPKFQSNINYLLGDISTNNVTGGQSCSSTS